MKTENVNNTYQGVLGLDKLSLTTKTLIWFVCFALAAQSAVSGYFHISQIMGTLLNFMWISIISPTCIAVAILRLAGIKWRYAFLLFIFVPIVVAGAYFVFIFFAILATGNA
jgi:hypothetical protein